jgi:hypothetical protein
VNRSGRPTCRLGLPAYIITFSSSLFMNTTLATADYEAQTFRRKQADYVVRLHRQIRAWILFMMAAIVLSGVTAFPLETELTWLQRYSDHLPSSVAVWLQKVYVALHDTNARYSFLAYGYDWLAFAHLVIAMAFIGPLRDPVRNVWIIEWGMLCCIAVFPLALIAGPIRNIPFFHQVIDCCFGLLGLIPLATVRQKIRQLANAQQAISDRLIS